MWNKTRLGQYPEDVPALKADDGTLPVLCIDAYRTYFVQRRIYNPELNLYTWEDSSRNVLGWIQFEEFDE